MNANVIKIGTKLEIEIPDNNINNTSQSSGYISQLLDIVDAKTIIIAAPMSEGRLKYLSADMNVSVNFLNERQELMCFKAAAKGNRKLGPLEAFELTITGEFEKIQRRSHYRLDAALCSHYTLSEMKPLHNEKLDFKKIPQQDLKKAYTKNISGNGLCLVLDEPLDQGVTADITLELEGMGDIRILAEAIRSIKIENKKYEVGMNFTYITPQDSNILTKFIFEKQRLMLKNKK